MITKTFTSVDQLDPVTKEPIDKIFTIKEVETIEYEKEQTLSGTEVQEKIKRLEEQRRTNDTLSIKIQEEIDFLKTLK